MSYPFRLDRVRSRRGSRFGWLGLRARRLLTRLAGRTSSPSMSIEPLGVRPAPLPEGPMIWFLVGLTVGGTLGPVHCSAALCRQGRRPATMIGDRLDHYGRRE